LYIREVAFMDRFMYFNKLSAMVAISKEMPKVEVPIMRFTNRVYSTSEIYNSEWRIESTKASRLTLIDPTGERRRIKYGIYHQAINYSSWSEYDIALADAKRNGIVSANRTYIGKFLGYLPEVSSVPLYILGRENKHDRCQLGTIHNERRVN